MNRNHLKLILLFIILPGMAIGQTIYKGGKVTYGVDLEYKSKKEAEPSNKQGHEILEKMFENAKAVASGITCVLKFNSDAAYFYAEEGMNTDHGSSYGMALLHLQINGPYFSNLEQKEILQEREAFGKKYLVEEDFSSRTNWKITSENKQIGNYNTFKATTTDVVINGKGTFESEVIAWFAPEVPFSFGPIGYGGLPGLILELEIKSNFPTHYFAKTIEIKKEEIALGIPSTDDRISAEELEGMFRKAGENLREF